MSIEIIPIGGFSEIGRNCVAIKVDDEVVILDMGLHLENYIHHSEATDMDDVADMSEETLIEVDAVPNIRSIDSLKEKVVGICISHAHLDHVGAVPFLANNFDCPIYGSPFTIKVLTALVSDNRVKVKNELIEKKQNTKFRISKNIEVEFISVTHSTPQTVIIAVHTKYGGVLYANDIKLDDKPMLGEKTNIKRLKEIKTKALFLNCLYSTTPGHTDSESVPANELKHFLLDNDLRGKNIFVTTFSSQIARIKTVRDLAIKMGRKPVFLGRSLAKYTYAAQDVNLVDFSDVNIVKYSNKVRKFLAQLPNPEDHLFIITGNQGEPNATLSKIVYQDYFNFKPGDIVIFSCTVIPVEGNLDNRNRLEEALKQKHVDVYKDIHASGHARHEDHRDFLKIVEPEYLIPLHGDRERMEKMKELGIEEGIEEKKVLILRNDERIVLN
ncbi:MBL fold metallo-hydrolase [archaeon]|nr:MBL fold metallo-hydrolase [archaeon]MBL7056654.1 MBL fold metallo-hydrolase [Candidatus Woesearchaeota archaeon]